MEEKSAQKSHCELAYINQHLNAAQNANGRPRQHLQHLTAWLSEETFPCVWNAVRRWVWKGSPNMFDRASVLPAAEVPVPKWTHGVHYRSFAPFSNCLSRRKGMRNRRGPARPERVPVFWSVRYSFNHLYSISQAEVVRHGVWKMRDGLIKKWKEAACLHGKLLIVYSQSKNVLNVDLWMKWY